MMKRTAMLLLGVALPGLAFAEDVYIRVEAKRGPEAAMEAATQWQSRISDLPVVTFPLGDDWLAVALGPLPRELAEPQMTALKEARTIPADSMLAPAGRVEATALSDNRVDQTGAASMTETPVAEASTAGIVAGAAAEAAPQSQPEAADDDLLEPAAPEYYIRIVSYKDRAEADAALARWRQIIPEAGLWQLPDDRLSIAAGPLSEAAATQWRDLLANGDAIPSGSIVAPLAEMGSNLTFGKVPEWPEAPETAAEMPPMEDVQDLLSWLGYYDGEIDGQSGPKTRAAIAAAIASQRATPDPADAIRVLMDQRLAWRQDMGLSQLSDDYTGLQLIAPMSRLVPLRTERALSIYGPKDDSGAALILFSQEGGQQEMEDITGLITALGWVPSPKREVKRGLAVLSGQNDTHSGRAEARVKDGRAEGWVLIWPLDDATNAPRIAAEIADSFSRFQPSQEELAAAAVAAVQEVAAQSDEEAEAAADGATPAQGDAPALPGIGGALSPAN
ncbi:MAG: peptidoglycan-binding domain-containing protein [Paracoccus sp. (in: a-proteobacteria)]